MPEDILAEDMEALPSIYCFASSDIDDLLHCIKKEFKGNANYTEGHDNFFPRWMQTYHPIA